MNAIFYIVILWAIIRWIYNFFIKYTGGKWYNPADILFLISMFFIVFSIISILIVWWEVTNIKYTIVFAFLNSLFYFFWWYFNFKWQREVPAYVFYSIARFRPIILLFIWMLFFREYLNINQIAWVVLTIISWMLILKKDKNNKKFDNYNLWIIYSVISLILYTASVTFYKVWVWYASIFYFILITHLFTIPLSLLTKRVEKKPLWINNDLLNKDYIIISFFLSVMLFIADAIYAYWLQNINVSIVSALSIIATFVPIAFAFLFFKEKITITKVFALIIMLFSIYLLK